MRSKTYIDTLIETPQSERVPGREDQVENYAGGQVFQLDEWGVLDRFLILGTEHSTYYATARKVSVEALNRVLKCVASDPTRVVRRAIEVSVKNLAPSNSHAIFILALVAAKATDRYDKSAAYHAILKVCRTGTHLFEFVDCVKRLKGTASGLGLRRALQRWYTRSDVGRLEYQLLKYRQRDGWSHRDVLRLAKPRSKKDGLGRDVEIALGHAVGKPETKKGGDLAEPADEDARRLLIGYEAALGAMTMGAKPKIMAQLIADHRLTREMVPAEYLAHREVWEALLPGMPAGAMLRNLGKLTQLGLLKPLSDATMLVISLFTDVGTLKRARLHPAAILNAHKIYSQGHGLRGSLSWAPVQEIQAALEVAFTKSFDAIEPTGKRFYLGVDVSSSMNYAGVAGLSALTAAEGAAAMAMSVARVEPRHVVLGFASGYGGFQSTLRTDGAMRDLGVTARDSMTDVLRKTREMNFGRTDCALPMLDAMARHLEVDCFVILTDNETWVGGIHPYQALRKYRQESGVPARLVVVAMTGTQFTIADPTDAGMLDVVGFDASAPGIIQNFAKGEV